ncbi:MAG: TonB-dependent receptor, partial [Pseudomonadota bacterium]
MNRFQHTFISKAVFFALCSALPAIALSSSAFAKPTESSQIMTILDIKAGPIGDTLQAISIAFDIDIIANESELESINTIALQGSMTAVTAIEQAIQGTELTFSKTSSGGYSIKTKPVESSLNKNNTQQASEATDSAEVIIVRGTRANRKEFETATSVSVFTQRELDRILGANDTESLLLRIPNIVVTSGTGEIVRGVDTQGPVTGGLAFAAGSRPRLSSVVDGYAQFFSEYIEGVTSIYDVQQIEVFRGPQTTAQGVNAIAGAIYVFTNDPTFENEAGITLEKAEYGQYQAAGFVSGPIISDELAMRIAVDYRESEPFNDFSPLLPSNIPLGETMSFIARAKVLWTPSKFPELEAKLTYQYADTGRPTFVNVTEPFEDRRVGFQAGQTSDQKNHTGIFDISYEFNEALTLTNQLTFGDFDTVLRTPAPAGVGPRELQAGRDGTRLTNETILRYQGRGMVNDGLVGTYLQQQEFDGIFFPLDQETNDKQDSMGMFGQASFQLTEKLELITGLRYQRDSQDREGVFFLADIDFDITFDAWLPKMELAYDLEEGIRLGASASKGFNPGGIISDFFTSNTFEFEEETVWTYDIYGRFELLGGRLRLDGNVFYSDYEGYQNFSIVGFDPQTGSPISNIANAPRAESYGIEGSFNYTLNELVSLYGSLGLLETEFDDLVAPGQFEGFEFASAPQFTWFFGADFTPSENLIFSAQARRVGASFSDDDNIPTNRVEGYT